MVYVSSALSREVEIKLASKHEKENSCNILILLLNKAALLSNYVCVPFIMKEIG